MRILSTHEPAFALSVLGIASLFLAHPSIGADKGAVNPVVAQIVSEVSADSMLATIRSLQEFGTRYEYSPQQEAAADFLLQRLRTWSLAAESQWYTFARGDTHLTRNIVGTIRGEIDTVNRVVLVAHYDSRSSGDSSMILAPGANDNASGTSAVLEAARIFSHYRFAHTVHFLAVSAEEVGLHGSMHFVGGVSASGNAVVGAVNADMVGYPAAGDSARLVVSSYQVLNRLVDSAFVFNQHYNLGLNLVSWIDNTGASDHYPFAAAGYDALMIIEATVGEIWGGADPFYHKTSDTVEKLSSRMLRGAAQLMIAVAAELAQPLGPAVSVPIASPVPAGFSLAQNYPNPFNPGTIIRYTLPEKSDVRLRVVNMLGQEVLNVARVGEGPGSHEVQFDASGLSSGVYFYRLEAVTAAPPSRRFAESRRMILLR